MKQVKQELKSIHLGLGNMETFTLIFLNSYESTVNSWCKQVAKGV